MQWFYNSFSYSSCPIIGHSIFVSDSGLVSVQYNKLPVKFLYLTRRQKGMNLLTHIIQDPQQIIVSRGGGVGGGGTLLFPAFYTKSIPSFQRVLLSTLCTLHFETERNYLFSCPKKFTLDKQSSFMCKLTAHKSPVFICCMYELAVNELLYYRLRVSSLYIESSIA